MERQPIYHVPGESKCAHCGQSRFSHNAAAEYCPVIPTFAPETPVSSVAAAEMKLVDDSVESYRRQVVDLERLLKIRETVNLRLLRAAEELIVAPHVVAVVNVHEDTRTLGAALSNGKFFLRQLVRDGYEWRESQPIPGTPAALLMGMYLMGTDDDALDAIDGAIADITQRPGKQAAAGGPR